MNFLKDSLSEARKIKSMQKAFETVKRRQKDLEMSDFEERSKRLKKMKELSIGNESLFKEALRNLKANGFTVRVASSKEEAVKLILEEVGGEDMVVKSKSKTLNDLQIVEELALKKIQAVETDIGDRIIQLSSEIPYHPTGPACHLSQKDIADILRKAKGKSIPSDKATLVKVLKKDITNSILKAKIGIAGANAITAEEGGVVIVHNEGNIIEVMTRPKKSILVAGAEKIVPNLEEALNLIKLQIYCATGTRLTSHINILGGPTKSADIEKRLVLGVHGPEKIVIILIKNNLPKIPEKYRELLFCIGCGACLLDCPVYSVFGKKFGDTYGVLGGRGVLLSALAEEGKISIDHNVFNCLECGRCTKACPANIQLRDLLIKIKNENPVVSRHHLLNESVSFFFPRIIYLQKALRLKLLGAILFMHKVFTWKELRNLKKID